MSAKVEKVGNGKGVRLFHACTDTPKGRQKRGTLTGRGNSALSLIGYRLMISIEKGRGRERERGRERGSERERERGRDGKREKERRGRGRDRKRGREREKMRERDRQKERKRGKKERGGIKVHV